MMLLEALASTLVALAVERVAYRPLRNSPRLALLISAIGASFFPQYTIAGFFGTTIFRYPEIDVLEQRVTLPLVAVSVKLLDIVVIVAAVVMMVVLYAFVMR